MSSVEKNRKERDAQRREKERELEAKNGLINSNAIGRSATLLSTGTLGESDLMRRTLLGG